MRRRTYAALALLLLPESAPGLDLPRGEVSRPLPLGGDVPTLQKKVPYDPLLPSGETIQISGPFAPEFPSSGRFPLRVSGATAATRQKALQLLEGEYEELWLVGGHPLSGPGTLLWDLDSAGPDLQVEAEPLPSIGFDRAGTRCRGGLVDSATARRCALAGLVFERAPGTAVSLVVGLAHAGLTERDGPSFSDSTFLTKVNEHPETSAISRAPPPSEPDPSALFLSYLGRYAGGSATESGLLALGLSATVTKPRALRHFSEPDLLDVVRHSLGSSRETSARFFAAFSEERYVSGGGHWLGGMESEPARPAARIAASTLPRHLVLAPEFGPLGSLGLRLDLDIDPGLVAFRIFCEPPVSTVWSILRLGEHGELRGRVPIPFQEVAHEYGQRVGTDGASSLVLVGTNLGGVDLDHPYDPDHAPHETHACSVAVDALGEPPPAPAQR